MKWLKKIVVAVATVATAVTTGCGQETETAPVVDVSALQPGNYRTSPRTAEEVRKPENIDAQEALRLAKFVPLIMETEPKLVFGRIINQQNLFTQLNPPQFTENFTVDAPGFVVGWETRGQRREDELHGRAVTLTVLRYSTPDQATHAANYLADHYLNGKYPPKGPISIPDYPSARAYLGQYDRIYAWIGRGEYLVEIEVGPGVDIPPDPVPLTKTAKAVLDKQFTRLEGYRPTPAEQLDELPVENEEIIRFTLPAGEKVPEVAIGPDVALHLTERPDLTKRAFEDAGVDLLSLAGGNAGATIYRTSDSAAADRLKAFFISQLAPELHPVEAPPGLPSAHCVEDPEETQSLACYFTNGRYSAYIKDATQIQELHQKTAAQYLLLNEAPQ
ncbi:DUF7373 family lipoprotein [Nocardia carnea]|uniref:DUF7373 family lipoprotein n=1 Tax=Nocardia carnea TaxID=37328 RepID=UPI002456390C|nr:hypothetical protein [Nocardia carnea]